LNYATLSFSTIRSNTSNSNGGGVSGSVVVIRKSTIRGNHSNQNGGGVVASSDLTIVNSTISGNTANGNGGGIASIKTDATVDLDSVTVAYNTADLDADNVGDGGGIYKDDAAGQFFSQNSIIANNQDDSPIALAREHDCFGDFTSGASNLISDYDNNHCTGFGLALDKRNVDPLLLPLADNGGPTRTHALPAASPAVDHWTNCPDTDQRGVDRPQDGGSGTANCDIGAYERGTCPAPVPCTLNIDRDGNHILLDWDKHTENREVEIWRGTDPFDISSSSKIGTNLTNDTTYKDFDVIGDPLTNYYYAVRGQNACGDYSALSNIVGEFDFRLSEEETAQAFAAAGLLRFLHFALISLPLEGDDLPTTADKVAEYIDLDGSVKGVARWNPLTQSWVVRRVGNPFGTPDFPVSPGDVLFLALTKAAPDTFAWVGDVPAAGSIQNTLVAGGINAIIVPLDQSGEFTMTADGLAADIGDVTHVGFRSTAQQRWYLRVVGKLGLNFPVFPGYPYAVKLPETITIPPLWPIYEVK